MARYDAPFLVMRLSHPIGQPNAPKKIAVDYQAYTIESAIYWGSRRRARSRNAPSFDWEHGSQFWIEHRGQPARRRK